MKKAITRVLSMFMAFFILNTAAPTEFFPVYAVSSMAQRILDDTSLGLSANKKQTMATIIDTMTEAGYEPAFIAGLLGNVAKEGSFGLFEGTTKTGHTDYMQYMTRHYQYYEKYSYKYIYNCNLTEVCKMDNELYAMNYKNTETGRCGFGIGCIQWTFGRTHGLMQKYKEIAGNSNTITYEQVMLAECLYMVQELNGGYHSVYTNWKSANSGNISSSSAASSAARYVCTQYEKPSGFNTENVQGPRADMAAKIFNVCVQSPIPEPKTYTVIYNANCGEGTMENSTMTYDLAAKLRKNTFTRAGYSFECWSDGKGNYYSDQQSVKNLTTGYSITLWAKWKPNTYSVKYDANTGSGKMENSTMTFDQASKLRKNAFTKPGYSFECWSDGIETKNYYSDQQSVKNLAESGTVTLWVKWKPNTYTIRYDANTGSGTMENSIMTYDQAAKLRKNTFTKTGYTFECWSDGKDPRTYYSDQQSVKNLAENGTVTLWAKWKPNTYTIFLNPNGSSVTPTSITVSYNGTYSGLKDATRTGYVFAGWYTEKEGGTRISPSTPVEITANQTLYAHWVDKTAPTISNVTAESVSMEGFKINATVADDAGLKAVTAYVSTWRGYDTDGKEITLKKSGNVWTADVKISDFNNSYGAYYFRVAATDVNGNTISSDTVEVKIGVSICTFDPNGGTVEPTSKTLVYGYPYSRLANLPIPNRTGYTFDGWYTAKTDGTRITDDDIVTTTEDHTLYARWSPNYVTVHYNTNGGTITNSTEYNVADNGDICLTETKAVREFVWTYNYTNKNGLVNASSFKLSRNNYKFVGWSTDPASETIFDQDDATVSTIDFFPDIVSTNGSVTFYARWEIDPPKNIDLRNGDQFELGITNDQLTFSSNEPRVAVISPSGVITALGPGEAIITILDEDNNAIQINITVLPVMMIGDVDLDRELTITDVILLQKWLLTEPDTSLPDWVAGDMNSDGKLNAIDLTLLKQMLLK